MKAGEPSTDRQGGRDQSMATMTVLQQALKARANIVITTKPTFYSRADVADGARRPWRGAGTLAPDPVFAAKNEFIVRNRLVVFRLSDHWQQRRPDPRVQGLATAFGWSKHQAADNPQRSIVPAMGLDALAGNVRDALRSRGGIRVIGDPRIAGDADRAASRTTPIQAALKMLPAVDVIVAGEVREWETVEYVRDKVFAGEKKALVLVGTRHIGRTGDGRSAPDWLKTFVSEVPIRHISAGDPFWRPPHDRWRSGRSHQAESRRGLA